MKEVTYALRSAPAQNMRPAPVKIATLQETKNTVSASPCTCMYDNTETESHGGLPDADAGRKLINRLTSYKETIQDLRNLLKKG